jgi:uncharacterized membrane protein
MGRVTLSGVPVHPALVHFPVVFWILGPLLDLGNGLDREGPYRRLGWFFAFAVSLAPCQLLLPAHWTLGRGEMWPLRKTRCGVTQA